VPGFKAICQTFIDVSGAVVCVSSSRFTFYQFQHGADGQADTHNQIESCAYAGTLYHLEGCLVQETKIFVAWFRDVVLLLIVVFQLVPGAVSPCQGQQYQKQPHCYTIANPRQPM